MTDRFDGRQMKNPSSAPLPYVQGKVKKLIIGSVSVFHAGLIVIPILFMTIARFLDPPLFVMNIPIVDSLPNDNLVMSPHPSPDRPYSTGTPEYGEPKPLSGIPDVPAIPKAGPEMTEPEGGPEKTEPKPETKQEPKPEPEPEPEPEKKLPTDKKETVVKENPTDKTTEKLPTLTGKKPVTKSKYKSANEIKISTKKVKVPTPGQGSGTGSGRGTAQSTGSSNGGGGDPNRREIGNMIRSLTGVPGGRGLPGGGGGPKGVVSSEVNDYYNAVEVFLKRRWDQPNVVTLNHAKPKVIVRFKVDSTGRLLSAVIISKSGINAMDASVQALLSSLNVLPTPPMAMEFMVTLEIDR